MDRIYHQGSIFMHESDVRLRHRLVDLQCVQWTSKHTHTTHTHTQQNLLNKKKSTNTL